LGETILRAETAAIAALAIARAEVQADQRNANSRMGEHY